MRRLLIVWSILILALPSICWSAGATVTVDGLKARIEEAGKSFSDLTMVGNVTYSNKKTLEKVEPSYSQMYEFKNATISLKQPDKLRIEGKLGAVKFEYIVNGCLKIFRSPTLRINRKKDYSDSPGKLQDALDIGLVTSTLWRHRSVEVVDDADAQAKGEIKLRLRYPNSGTIFTVWIDAQNLWLKRFEKRDDGGNLKVTIVYSNPKNAAGVIWVPTKVQIFAPDGEKAGESEFSDIKVNMSLPDSVFQ